MDQKTILILGGGVGGQVAANNLASRLNGRCRVVLVDREKNFVFPPSFPWLIVGQRKERDVQRPLSSLLKKGVELIQGEVLRIDPVRRTVETSAGSLSFDYLLISLGAELAPGKIPGFQEAALNLYTLEGSVQIQKSLSAFSGQKVVVLIASSPFKCPAAPYEAAFLIKDFFRKKRHDAEVAVFTPEPFPMPTAGAKVGGALRGMLESKGIGFHPNHKVVRINTGEKTIIFEDGKSVKFDLLIGVPPHQAPKAVRESGMVNESGWIPVDRQTLATKHQGVYAIGDVAAIPIAQGKALPKAGIFAHYQAEIAAKNILRLLSGETPEYTFDGAGWCAIEVGAGLAAFGSGNFYAANGPDIQLYSPGIFWHLGRVLFEKWWLCPFGLKRELLRLAIKLGARTQGKSV